MNIIKPYKFISKKDIEDSASNLLEKIQEKYKRPLKWPIDPTRIADFLDIGVVWDKITPDDKGLIAAMILPTKREIIINQEVSGLNEGYGASTLAHEIGHWILHIDQNAVGQFIERLDQGIEIQVKPFLCRSENSQQGIEWQAQYFASCLLMPQFILEQKRQGRNLTKWSHLYAMKDELGVTISNLTNRLQEIGWISIPKGSKQIYLVSR